MAQEFDLEALQKQRKAKKRAKTIKKLAVFLVLLCVAGIIYSTRESWLPFFNGIATRYAPVPENDGTLAEGNFPLKVSEGTYYMDAMDSQFTVVDDTRFTVFSEDGAVIQSKEHSMSGPMMCTNSKKALLYEIGGVYFNLESKYKNVYANHTDNKIVLGRLGATDYAAIVTLSDKFVCELNVYDGTGNAVYSWKSADTRITDVAFVSSDGCIAATVDETGGQLYSTLHRFRFGEYDELWHTDPLNTLIISQKVRSDGSIVVFGDDKCAYYSSDGALMKTFLYADSVVGFDASDTVTAFITRNEGRRRSKLTIISDAGAEPVSVMIDGAVKKVFVDGADTYVLFDGRLEKIAVDGTVVSSVEISDEYTDFVKIGTKIFLKGSSGIIDRIDFS